MTPPAAPPPEADASGITAFTRGWELFIAHLAALSPTQWALGAGASAVVLLIAWLLRRVLHRAIAVLFKTIEERRPDARSHEPVRSALCKTVTVVVVILASLALGEIWGIATVHALLTNARLGDALVSIALVVVLAVLASRAVALTVTYLLASSASNRRDARTETAVQVIIGLAKLVIGILATLLILSELGVNIAPLIAGAGIVGLAVGFGAQSLVKDLLTGLMIIFEDSIAVGDVVTIGAENGRVERLGVRTLRLRAVDGTLHIIPYGAVTVISNMTKDFSFAMLDIAVSPRADTDRVIELMRQVAGDMAKEDNHARVMLEPIDIMGVHPAGESALSVRARIKTLPGERWGIEREFNHRIRPLLEANGIAMPIPQMTVLFADGKPPPTGNQAN